MSKSKTVSWVSAHWLVPAGVAIVLAMPVRASMVLGIHDWDTDGHNWQSQEGFTTLTDPVVGGGNPDGWLQIQFDATAAPEQDQAEWFDVVYVDAQALFPGQWDTSMNVGFDFLAQDAIPGTLQVQWSSSTNSDVWAASLNPPTATNEWTSQRVYFDDWTAWQFPGATEDQFLSDLASIDWIGVYIYRTGADQQSYGLDNFSLMVPEPTQLAMIGAAVIASVFSMRRRREDDET